MTIFRISAMKHSEILIKKAHSTNKSPVLKMYNEAAAHVNSFYKLTINEIS